MKSLVLLVVLGMFVGCSKHGRDGDASSIPPHSGLVDSEWVLTKDAFLIRVSDNPNVVLIIPATKPFGAFTPDGDCSYSEEKIGKAGNGVEVAGGLRAGEVLKVVRVVKNTHIEMGTTYHPIMVPVQNNRWTGDTELDGVFLYDDFEEQGVLNPDYVEKVE